MKKLKPIVYLFLISCIIPLVLVGFFAVSGNWIFPNILPEEFTLKHLNYVMNNSLGVIISSLILGFMCGIVTILIALPTAKAMAYYNFRFKNLVLVCILIPLILPPFTIVSVSHTNMMKFGLDGTLLGVCLVHAIFSIPYAVRILTDYFIMVPFKYEQSARCLGANRFQVLKYITLPIIKRGVLVSFFLSFTISMSQYVTTLVIGSGRVTTLSTLIVPYIQYGDYEVASVYSLIIIIVSMVGYLIAISTQKIIKEIIWG